MILKRFKLNRINQVSYISYKMMKINYIVSKKITKEVSSSSYANDIEYIPKVHLNLLPNSPKKIAFTQLQEFQTIERQRFGLGLDYRQRRVFLSFYLKKKNKFCCFVYCENKYLIKNLWARSGW